MSTVEAGMFAKSHLGVFFVSYYSLMMTVRDRPRLSIFISGVIWSVQSHWRHTFEVWITRRRLQRTSHRNLKEPQLRSCMGANQPQIGGTCMGREILGEEPQMALTWGNLEDQCGKAVKDTMHSGACPDSSYYFLGESGHAP